MRFLKFIFLTMITTIHVVYASEYSTYNFVPINQYSLEQINKSLEVINLRPLSANSKGNASLFGANQIYINSDFSSIVSFKYDVKGEVVLDKWEYISSGIVYHYKSNGKINALFFHGVPAESAKKVIDKIKELKFVTSNFNPFVIEKIHAAECDSNGIIKIEYPMFEKLSSSVLFENLLSCASGAKTGAYDSTIGFAEMGWHGLEAIGDELQSMWTDPKQKMDQYYNGIVKGSLAVKDIFSFVSEMIVNPENASIALKNKYGQAAEKVISLFDHIKNLPDSIKIEMTCSILTGVGIDTIVTYLTFGAGSEKLALTMLRLSEKFETIGKLFRAIDNVYNQSKYAISISKEKLELFTRKLLKSEVPEEDLKYINNMLGKSKSTDSTTIEALSCYIK